MMRRSLRSILLINITCISTFVFVCVAIVLFVFIRRSLWAEFDALSGAKARALAAMIEQDGDWIEIEFHEHPMQEFARQERPEYYQVWSDDGSVLARSRRLETTDLQRFQGSLIEPGSTDAILPDGRRGRLTAVRFLPREDGNDLTDVSNVANVDGGNYDEDDDELPAVPGIERGHITLVIARETAEVDEALTVFGWTFVGVFTTAVLLMIIALAWILTRKLRPLDRLASQIGTMDVDSLSGRVSLEDAPAELQPVVHRLNELLVRIEESFTRERTFSANIAHELRTPLAGMRSTLDVTLSRTRDSQQYRESLHVCKDICAQTQQLMCALLAMARLESGQQTIDYELIDLRLALETAWEPFRTRAGDRQVTVSLHCESEVFLQTDASLLHLVLRNLLDNAITYVDDGGWISIDSAIATDGLQIEIANSGCRITAEQKSRVFERFWRADVARTDTGTHAGLGLALCQRIAILLGATIELTLREEVFSVCTCFSLENVEILEPEAQGVTRNFRAEFMTPHLSATSRSEVMPVAD